MAAHTFEMSPHWTRAVHAEAPALVEPISVERQRTVPTRRHRIAAYWIAAPVAAMLVALAVMFIPTGDRASPRHDIPSSTQPTTVSVSPSKPAVRALPA